MLVYDFFFDVFSSEKKGDGHVAKMCRLTIENIDKRSTKRIKKY